MNAIGVSMLDNKRITIMVDGSGTGYSAVYFSDDESYFTYQDRASNNDAEYNAVILALDHLPANSKALILSDSELVVKQLNGQYRCKEDRLKEKKFKIQSIINKKNLDIIFRWIPREQNRADNALRKYLYKNYNPQINSLPKVRESLDIFDETGPEKAELNPLNNDLQNDHILTLKTEINQLKEENIKLKEENIKLREELVELKILLR
ncbi:hypothetical protein CUJ83_00745 [Methanocella sp. CWC-04]|uniref:RNase H type-1 domain-containing protein n=1 Tax=Methanooceanicella nereidis TaxID=2052831 RepID=A0AAP2R9S2_9EURY|nr:RNase H family protein [Methanocella sp. CWC-04]MCD1293523.1 hypothetical protein [Methanocella sp. CWC-04]